MDRKNFDHDELNCIEQMAKELFGYDEASLLAEMDKAEAAWEAEKKSDPEAAEREKRETAEGFERLMARIKAEGIQPATEETRPVVQTVQRAVGHVAEGGQGDAQGQSEIQGLEAEPGIEGVKALGKVRHLEDIPDEPAEEKTVRIESQKSAGGKRFRLTKKRKRILLVAALAGALCVGMSIGVVAQRRYDYELYPIKSKQNIVVRQNAAYKNRSVNLENAYKSIKETLGIDVVCLGYIPEKTQFKGLILNDEWGVIELESNGRRIYLREEKYIDSETVMQMTISDRTSCQKIYNEWLDTNIEMEENSLDTGEVEYSAYVHTEDASYYLSCMIEKEEFVKIIEGLHYLNVAQKGVK